MRALTVPDPLPALRLAAHVALLVVILAALAVGLAANAVSRGAVFLSDRLKS